MYTLNFNFAIDIQMYSENGDSRIRLEMCLWDTDAPAIAKFV